MLNRGPFINWQRKSVFFLEFDFLVFLEEVPWLRMQPNSLSSILLLLDAVLDTVIGNFVPQHL